MCYIDGCYVEGSTQVLASVAEAEGLIWLPCTVSCFACGCGIEPRTGWREDGKVRGA